MQSMANAAALRDAGQARAVGIAPAEGAAEENTNMACTRVEIEGNIARLIFSRPAVLNALNVALLREAAAHLDALRQRDDVHALVITGEGRGFCAGADLSEAAGKREEG